MSFLFRWHFHCATANHIGKLAKECVPQHEREMSIIYIFLYIYLYSDIICRRTTEHIIFLRFDHMSHKWIYTLHYLRGVQSLTFTLEPSFILHKCKFECVHTMVWEWWRWLKIYDSQVNWKLCDAVACKPEVN